MSTEMDRAHARDYADKRKCDDLAHAIGVFLAEPPTRFSSRAELARLGLMKSKLERVSAQVVRAWD